MIAKGLSAADMASLLANPRSRKGDSQPVVIVRDGNELVHSPGTSPTLYGAYEGRAGSIVRGSKGRTRRLANGSRRYINPALAGEVEVVAYKL